MRGPLGLEKETHSQGAGRLALPGLLEVRGERQQGSWPVTVVGSATGARRGILQGQTCCNCDHIFSIRRRFNSAEGTGHLEWGEQAAQGRESGVQDPEDKHCPGNW